MNKNAFIWLLSLLIHALVIWQVYFTLPKNELVGSMPQQTPMYESSFAVSKNYIFALQQQPKVEAYIAKKPFVELNTEQEVTITLAQKNEFSQPTINKIKISNPKSFLTEKPTLQRFIIHQSNFAQKQSTAKETITKEDSLSLQENQPAVKDTTKENSLSQENQSIAKEDSLSPQENQPSKNVRNVIVAPKLKNKVNIFYPQIAKRMNLSGKTILHVQVLLDGSVGNIKIIKSSSYDVLDHAAVENVKRWIFSPALKNQQPVISWIKVPIHFQMPKKKRGM